MRFPVGRRLLERASGAALAALMLAACAAPATTTATQTPTLSGDTARVWFLRQADPAGGNIFAADPVISANQAPVGAIQQGTAFFHDFSPGSYRFTVQSFGTPSPHQAESLQLAPGMQVYVQIEAVPNWELGSRAGGYGFAVQSMSPELARQYLATLKNLGQR